MGTELFVDVRNLLDAPQFAGYDIYEALLTGNSTMIDTALQTGLSQVDTAFSQFPVEVFDQIVAAFGGSHLGQSRCWQTNSASQHCPGSPRNQAP